MDATSRGLEFGSNDEEDSSESESEAESEEEEEYSEPLPLRWQLTPLHPSPTWNTMLSKMMGSDGDHD